MDQSDLEKRYLAAENLRHEIRGPLFPTSKPTTPV